MRLDLERDAAAAVALRHQDAVAQHAVDQIHGRAVQDHEIDRPADLVKSERQLYKGTHLTMDRVTARRARVVEAEPIDPASVIELASPSRVA